MGFVKLRIHGKAISVHKAAINPDFASRTVLVTDTWDYVDLWLKRRQKEQALFYWQQARDFYVASSQLPKTSSPLTAYYCFLNAAKTLLIVNGTKFSELHGLGGRSPDQKRALLQDEVIELEGSGVAPALCGYLKENLQPGPFSLKDILFNLVYIHRAYNLTFKSQSELFIPIASPEFVRKEGSSESWFCADINDPRYMNTFTLKKLSPSFERDIGAKKPFVVRKKKRFSWDSKSGASQKNIEELKQYHRKLRKELFYIYGPNRLWYIKRTSGIKNLIDHSSLSLTLWAMHRLSELARYQPTILAKHFSSRHNWLLSEFIATAPYQFIDEISSEITGHEFMIPGRRTP